jgi:type IV pilus assembly protein PilV
MAGGTVIMKRALNSEGFTLIEVMVALVVLLIGTMGVMGLQYYAVTGNAFSREIRTSTGMTQDMIERVKDIPYASIAAGTDAMTVEPSYSGNVLFTRRWWTVANCLGFPLAGDDGSCVNPVAAACSSVPDGAVASPVTAIKVRTCWTDKSGVVHSVTMDTMRWDENVTP